ncbi:unnamed protein product [Malus baccata var. baccata]
MYANLAKGQAFPLAIRVCSWPKSFHTSKFQSLQIGSRPKPPINLRSIKLTKPTCGFGEKNCGLSHLVRFSTGSYCEIPETGVVTKPRSVSGGFRIRSGTQSWCFVRGRGFSSCSGQGVDGGSGVGRAGKKLPWLPAAKARGAKGLEKGTTAKTSVSSWEESAKRLEEVSDNGSWGEAAKRLDGDSSESSWGKSGNRLEEDTNSKTGRASWDVSRKNYVRKSGPLQYGSREGRTERGTSVKDRQSDYRGRDKRLDEADTAKSYVRKSGTSEQWGRESRTGRGSVVKDRQSDYQGRDRRFEKADTEGDVEEEGDEQEEEMEAVDDPRWDRIQNKFSGMEDVKPGRERPEFRRWNRQEDWGKKTWKEATESSVPRMIGQSVYGVGPVLAALSAGRREFYALYVQEGMDLSKNNRKKKDKKGFERILMMADKIGVNVKDVSKHDLNMATDNRPHQGLVLDASPLEMVKINELDPVSVEEDKGSLWVALDEVTDPQNVGAIIRSAYFFGASGVVLCAKNSAPLSGVVSKASAGSLELMELRYCKNMMQFLTSSAENGWRVLGGSVSAKAIPLNEVAPSVPTILVLGSEGTGLRPLVERSCTDLIRIPGNIPVEITAGGFDDTETVEGNHVCSAEEFRSFLAVESLNVSVAAGVLLHHLTGNNNNEDVHAVNQQTDELD